MAAIVQNDHKKPHIWISVSDIHLTLVSLVMLSGNYLIWSLYEYFCAYTRYVYFQVPGDGNSGLTTVDN